VYGGAPIGKLSLHFVFGAFVWKGEKTDEKPTERDQFIIRTIRHSFNSLFLHWS